MHKFILNIYYRNNHIEFDMTKVNTVYIGNNTNSTIPIPSESISKKELKITKKNTLLNIDCLSGNGLIFKGKSVKNAKSGNCDVFSFGKEFSVVAIPIIYDNDKNNIIQVDISNKNLIYIGSSKKNTIYINNRLISSVHCCIEKDSQNNFIIKDLDSRNGVFANSKPVKATVLDKNTVINIVGIKIKVLNNILYIDPKGFDIEFRGLNSFNNTDISSIRNSYKKEISKKSIILFKRSPRIIPTYEKGVITIEDPPQISITPTISWFQVLIMPLVTTSIFVVMISMGGSMRYLYMSGTLAIVGILGALVNYFSQVKKHKKDCISRKEKYYAYLESLKTDFENIKKTYIGTILKNYPKVDECINFIKNLDKNLWERTPDDFDFLNIMIGNGILDFPYEIIAPEQKVFEEKDDLISNAVTLKDNFKSINNLPITLNIKKSGTIGLTGDRNISFDILKSMIIQISSLHSYDEVKIVCLYSEKESEKWEWIRWLPHSWNNERTIRYISNSKESSKVILNDVYDIIYRRKNQNSDNLTPLPYYIVFISDLKLIKNTPVYDYLIYNNEHLGISTVFLQDKFELLPKNCHTIVESNLKNSVIYQRENSLNRKSFEVTHVKDELIEYYSRKIAPIRIDQKSSKGHIPLVSKFLKTYAAKNFEDINILNNWENARPYLTLSAPIGFQSDDDLIFLDLHEKGEGPHGLVAGTTGSGKSELLQSIILSLSINYHPHDLVFLVIDYKGGGMANFFEKLPHLVGTITNLSGGETKRALLSIKSELKTRQKIFSSHNVNNIDDYLKLYKSKKANTPIPHLVIISDEFAELKQEQPEFMRELVSAARVGRSLGVHLILATQKPSGIVDDQIWSNSRFKLCLKVQSTSDSSEVLKRPDAAYIKYPGRAYLQVGNDEIFKEFQSSWSGAAYKEEKKEEAHSISIITINGQKISLPKKKRSEVEILKKPETELEAGVKYIDYISSKNNIVKLQGPWLNPLKEKIYLEDIIDTKTPWDISLWKNPDYILNPLTGLVDDPANQRQFPLEINLSKDGNLVIYGAPSTGKTTFLKTLLTNLIINHSPDELNIYLIDFGGMTLNIFNTLPHFGGIVFLNDEEKLNKLVILVSKEIAYRKKSLSKYNVTTLMDYNKFSDNKIPNMVLVFDNIAPLRELYPDVDTAITAFLRETGNLGINIIITASSINEISFRVSQYVKTSIALNLNDKGDYSSIVGRLGDIEPAKNPGRGLIKSTTPLEFQTALPIKSKNELEMNQNLNSLFTMINNTWQGNKATKIPELPENLSIDDLLNHNDYKKSDNKDNIIPYGLDTISLDFISINLTVFHCFLVSGAIRSGKSYFLNSLIKVIERTILNKSELYIVDIYNESLSEYEKSNSIKKYITSINDFSDLINDFMSVLSNRKKSYKEFKKNSDKNISERDYIDQKFPKTFLIIDDVHNIVADCSSDTNDNINSIIHYGRDLGIYLIFSATNDQLSNLYKRDALITSIIDIQYGIALGATLEKHDYFNTSLSYRDRSKHIKLKEAYKFEQGTTTNIKITSL